MKDNRIDRRGFLTRTGASVGIAGATLAAENVLPHAAGQPPATGNGPGGNVRVAILRMRDDAPSAPVDWAVEQLRGALVAKGATVSTPANINDIAMDEIA